VAKIKKPTKNQFESFDSWINFYNEKGKLPFGEIVCCECKTFYAKLKGAGMRHAMKNAGGDISVMLKSTMCKECKSIKVEKVPKRIPKKIKTREEIEDEIEQIRRDMPKIDLNAPRNIIDLKKDKKMCEILTESTCMRPDIYLDNDRTCDYCSINEYCRCRLKKFSNKRKLK
jgi:hypothetical protein